MPLASWYGARKVSRSPLGFLRDPLRFLVETYESEGSIFRLSVLGRDFVVLCGPEANRFLAKAGGEHLTSEPFFGRFASEIGSANFLVGIDGPRHLHLRRVMSRGYSKTALAPHLGTLIQLAHDRSRSWPVASAVEVRDQMQRLATEQLGLVLSQHATGERFRYLRRFLDTLLRVFIVRQRPQLALHTPWYRKAKREVHQMCREVLAAHAESTNGRQRDLIDDLLAARGLDGEPLSDSDLLAATAGPFVAGMHTVASTLAFTLYALLKHEEAGQRVVAEVDEHFTRDALPSLAGLSRMRALHGAIMEALRMYPVAPFALRGVRKAFVFAGCRVEAGERVLLATAVTHFLPQFFPRPHEFDIDRYAEPRHEHRRGGVAFAPFSLGTHSCLGAGIAEAQLMASVGAILRTTRLALAPSDYELKVKMSPIPGPERKFRVRVVEQRDWQVGVPADPPDQRQTVAAAAGCPMARHAGHDQRAR